MTVPPESGRSQPGPGPAPWSFVQEQSVALLLIGTVVGLVLLGVGVFLTIEWISVITGGLAEWRTHWWKLGLVILCHFGGLGIIFASLQLARSEERTNATMRRVIYGFTAVLTGILLLDILLALNVLTYIPMVPFSYLGASYDWTESTPYATLSPETKKFLKQLDKPTKVYLLLHTGDRYVSREAHTLFDNCRALTKNLEVVYLSPNLNPESVDKLVEQYHLPEREGILVVYGPEGQQESEFIKRDDIVNVAGGGGDPKNQRIVFKGESAFITKLNFLVEGKAKPVIYFTQDNGELELNNFSTERLDIGLGQLKDKLTRVDYSVKELKFGPETKEIPEDAAIVVMVRPTSAPSPAALDALHAYMNPPPGSPRKKGKLFVLLDVVKTPQGTMAPTMEGFLQEFGVQAGNDRVLTLYPRSPSPLQVLVLAAPQNRTPIAEQFRDVGLMLRDVRPIQPKPAAPNAPGGYQAEPLFVIPERSAIFTEPNLGADPLAVVQALAKEDRRSELRQRLSKADIPVAVTVTEPQPPSGNDPHEFMRPSGQTPRMVVFGDASWLSNRWLAEPDYGQVYFDLFTGCLAWLRDRPDVAAVAEAKERKAFIVKAKDPEELYSRLYWIPFLLLGVGIIGLGAGVWVVRRR
jgi:hypothetical protein